MSSRSANIDAIGAAAALSPGTDVPPRGDVHRRIDDIELLRGVAVIFVLIEHTRINLVTWKSDALTHLYAYFGFWTGVDLFFAISGFVIARSLLPSLEECRDDLAFFNTTIAFWVRRAWRLLPSAWLWLAFLVVASVAFNRSGAFRPFHDNVEGAVAAVFDLANIWVAEGLGHHEFGASFPYWSLSLEEQFYLLLPVAVFLFRRNLVPLIAAAVVLQIVYPRSQIAMAVVLRTDALLLGVLIAIWSAHPSYKLFEPTGLARNALMRFAMLGLLLVLLAALGSDQLAVSPQRVGVVALVSAALVLIASYDRDYLMRKGPLKRLLLWAGSRSYALYLVHIPAFFLTREIWFRLSPPDTVFGGRFWLRYLVTAAILLVLFAELNFRLVETPLRRRGARIAERLRRRVVAPS